MLYNKEKIIFNKAENALQWMNTYYGYDINYFLNSRIINENQYIYIDLSNSFYTFEHFFQFTIVKIFRKFIRTKLKINTIGQLYNFLKKLNFDREILLLLKSIIENKDLRVQNFIRAWDTLFLLGEKLNISNIIISNVDFFYEDRRNFKSEIDNVMYHIIKRAENSSFKVIFEFKNIEHFRKFIKKTDNYIKMNFEDNDFAEDDRYYNYYGELGLYLENLDISANKVRIDGLLNKYISKCRGENQVRYILLLISFSKDNGLTVSELSNLMNISVGACGSVLNRIMQIGLIRKDNKRFLLKNNAFRNFILEKDI